MEKNEKWEVYKVEKNLPIPPPGRWEERNNKYPFGKMEIGDSFLIPKSHMEHRPKMNMSYFSGIMKKHKPKKFSGRRTADGLRIWRVE